MTFQPDLSVEAIGTAAFAEYQPIIDLNHNRIVACEALARWRAPDGAVSSIDDVIHELEVDHDLALALTARMLACISADLRLLLYAHPEFSVSVNMAPAALSGGRMQQLLETAGLTGHLGQLTGEITERQALDALGKDAIKTARKELGTKIAIDDFGTGRSGLQQLIGLEVDILKIDRSFVSLIGKDIAAERLVRGIAALAAVLKAEVVAEGIETQEQASFLRAIGVEKGQGWLWSKAVDSEALGAMLDHGGTLAHSTPET